MRVAYDLHIHTALSPCGDGDMTPNNIVNMARIKELDVIAITDHNTCRNAKACMECAEGTGLVVIPGMEVETSEECHIVCLFADIESAMEMERVVRDSLPPIKNRVDIFGEQVIMDKDDNITGHEENMLVTATSLTVSQVADKARELGGVVFPAHIDKSSYSVISNLGYIDESYGFTTVEVKDPAKVADMDKPHQLSRFRIVHNSDAHYLWDISERQHFIDVDMLTAKGIIDKIKEQKLL